ncbi:MAG: hypothetical protein GY737_00305 [Desulfobacteraceae bacterium]|nr:hypothetical protein [Desulfobacteraceae bacterium]
MDPFKKAITIMSVVVLLGSVGAVFWSVYGYVAQADEHEKRITDMEEVLIATNENQQRLISLHEKQDTEKELMEKLCETKAVDQLYCKHL